jgi:two-component system, sporulation sensor kinase A
MMGEEYKHDLFYASFNYAAVGMALVDTQGNFFMVNRSLSRITGYTKAELLKMNFKDITHQEDLAIDIHLSKQLINKELDYYEMEKRYVHKDGHTVWIHLSVSSFQEKSGHVYLISQVKDITGRKKAEEKLKKSEEQYRKLVDLCPDPICVHNINEILYLNEAGKKVLGVTEEEVVGKPILNFINKDYHRDYFELVNNHLDKEQLEVRICLPDGREKEILCASTGIMFQGENAFQVVFRDNTYHKELEKENNILLLKSEKMNLVGELAAGIAHEIRNPLTSLKGFLQLLSSNYKDKTFPYDSIIFSEIDRINFIVNELMLLAKPTKDELKRIDIKSVIEQMVVFMKAQANMYNIEIHIDFPESSLPLNCSENKLKQVFINILQNSIEAMSNGGRIWISVKEIRNAVILSFKDEGCGIPEELIGNIGTPFFTTKNTGTGLGLMVTNNIIQNHRGSLEIKSRENEGTEIIITLPLSDYR